MKLLAEISEQSLGIGETGAQLDTEYRVRKSARAILLNENGEIAVQYLNTYTFHKLPGGGVEADETVEEGLLREIQEEVGCDAEIITPIGLVIEYRHEKYKLFHLSYCYVAKVKGEIGKPALEEAEIEEGQETLWLTPEEALAKMETDAPLKYEGHFILAREKAFLKAYLQG